MSNETESVNMGSSEFMEFLEMLQKHFRGRNSCLVAPSLKEGGATGMSDNMIGTVIVTLEPPDNFILTAIVSDFSSSEERFEYWEGIFNASDLEAHVSVATAAWASSFF